MWNFKEHCHRTAFFSSGGSFSYSDLEGACDKIASCLPGRSLFFLLTTNTPGSVAGYAAALRSGNVPLMLDSASDRGLLARLRDIYRPDYLWLPESMAGTEQGEIVLRLLDYALIRTGDSHVYPLHPDLALLLTTSGSVGSPKLVRQTYENLDSNTAAIRTYLELTESERAITALPMNYTFGLSIINTHLAAGASLILTDASLMQREFWTLFSEFKATSLSGVPYTFEMLDRMRFPARSFPSLRTITQAGGKLSAELHRKFAEYAARTGMKFIVMYGQTEATARMSYLPADRSLDKIGSIGIAIPGGRFSLSDGDGSEITTPGTVGELIYHGANVTPGYAESGVDLALGDSRNGILETGDMAFFDTDGFFTITGRKKRFLKIFGNRVSLDETESLLKSKFPGIEVACAGTDDHMKIFLTDSSVMENVRAFLSGTTRLNPSAFEVVLRTVLPRSNSGKIQYGKLEENS